jgi:uncharacterized protein (TIGR02246 family)
MNSDREQSVLATFDATAKAWADGDAHAFAAWYADDATAILPGFYQRSREEIQAGMAAAFAGPLNGSLRVHEPQSVRFADEDTAIVVTMSATLFAGEVNAPAERQDLATWVLTRYADRWLIRAYHGCPAS